MEVKCNNNHYVGLTEADRFMPAQIDICIVLFELFAYNVNLQMFYCPLYSPNFYTSYRIVILSINNFKLF